MRGKTLKRIYFLILLKRAGRSPPDIIDTYNAIIRSVIDYACIVLHPALTKQQSFEIKHIQKDASVSPAQILHMTKQWSQTIWSPYMKEEQFCVKNLFMNIQNESHRLPPPRDVVSLRSFRKYELVKGNRLMKSINYGIFKFQNTVCAHY